MTVNRLFRILFADDPFFHIQILQHCVAGDGDEVGSLTGFVQDVFYEFVGFIMNVQRAHGRGCEFTARVRFECADKEGFGKVLYGRLIIICGSMVKSPETG